MKKYLCPRFHFIFLVLAYILAFTLLGLGIYFSEGNVLVILLIAFPGAIIIAGTIYGKDIFYSWGYFGEKGILIKSPFAKRKFLEYEKLKSCGLTFFLYNTLSGNVCPTVVFIYFSYDYSCPGYIGANSAWKTKAPHTKVEFNKELYDYLMSVLPKKQARMLSSDYNHYKNKYGDKFIRLTS